MGDTYTEKWFEQLPLTAKHLLEDMGYFEQDINLIDAIKVTELLLKRLLTYSKDDYYYNLSKTDKGLHLSIILECVDFLLKHGKATQSGIRGKLHSL